MKKVILFALASLLLESLVVAQSANNLTGVWEVTFKTPQGELITKAYVKQENEKLSGRALGPRGQRSERFEGTIKGTEVKVSFTIGSSGNNDLAVVLIGQVNGDAMKGKADFGHFEGDWSAKRLAEPFAEASPPAADNAPAKEPMDVNGLWVFEVERAAGTTSLTFLFKQEGEKLSGQFKGAFEDAPLAGTVTGNEIKFSYKVATQGGELTLTYNGIIENGVMKGEVQFGNQDSGKWTAKRK